MSSSDEEEVIPTRLVRRRRNYCNTSSDAIGDAFVEKGCLNKEESKEDRISSLSDEIIHKIMSFMNTKYAVQTCVLSKRWESLWKSLPYLDFNCMTFPFKGVPWEDYGRYREEEEETKINSSFHSFITQVLFRRHHTNLVKVCVQTLYEAYGFNLQGLIAYALDHNVKQLSIMSDYGGDFVLPESFYTCQSLEAVHLQDSPIIPKFLALPALKSLHLDRFKMTSKSFNFRNFSVEGYECKVVINAPRLMSFWYCGYAPTVCSSVDLASIDDAYFDMRNKYIYGDWEVEEFVDMYIDICPEHVHRLINTLKEFRHARSLTLSMEAIQALSKFPSLLDVYRLPFANLKYLKIKVELWRSCIEAEMHACVLNFFFNSSANAKLEFCK
ncbi:hypothetical protein COLO4_38579 [Corchorus olitorius]|uniref:F-box domain-containing protein n=1 Tax=Corchorus olitorius TaxID=93759 RepID=A0A1R3FU28_9ROSI|nr:hypothetical protein COLO4_38579 [Corchorus olitorius]